MRDGTTHKTLTEETLSRLRRDIVSGAFEAGGKIKSEDLKRRYGVGTSPLREALFQLVSEGLVRSDGQKGFRVAELSLADLLDVADWRARLECEALRRSIARGDMEWEAGAVAALHRLKHVEARVGLDMQTAAELWEDLHRAFHHALYAACGSAWLLRFCELLILHSERYRRAYIAYPNVAPSIVEEHEAILAAAVARDADRAAGLLESHIRHAAEIASTLAAGESREVRTRKPRSAARPGLDTGPSGGVTRAKPKRKASSEVRPSKKST